jgi:hypothetical protein
LTADESKGVVDWNRQGLLLSITDKVTQKLFSVDTKPAKQKKCISD